MERRATSGGLQPKEAVPLPDTAWQEIVQRLNEDGNRQMAELSSTRRLQERRRYCKVVRCVLRLKQGQSPPAIYMVHTRNLSEGGLGFFFGSYLHPGTQCHLAVMDLEGNGCIFAGAVRWCRHVGQTLHECGVQFEQHIDICRFLDPQTTPLD